MLINNTTDNYRMQVQAVQGYRPAPYDYVTARQEGDYVTMKHMQRPVLTHVKRVDATHYKVISTGEIHEYETMDVSARRQARRASLNRTFAELRALIRSNFANEGKKGSNSQLFVTLTYAENMQDEGQLYKDFKNFYDRLYRAYPDDYVYIAVMEPQGRGAWHVHLMLRSKTKSWLWIDKEEISRLWGYGYTTTARLKSDDIGAYYTVYFTGLIRDCHNLEESADDTGEDILRDEELADSFARVSGEAGLKKSVVKGSRLALYPSHFKFYRTSRNVKRPKGTSMMYNDLQYDDTKLIYERSYEINKVHMATSEKFVLDKGIVRHEVGDVESINHIWHGTYKRTGKGGKNFDRD